MTERKIHYTVCVPVLGKDEVTRYTRVGVMFENATRENGEVYYALKLDFPVGAQELLCFQAKPREDAAKADAGKAA